MSLNETCEEDEVFFGKVSEKERMKIAKLAHRRTEIFQLNNDFLESKDMDDSGKGSTADNDYSQENISGLLNEIKFAEVETIPQLTDFNFLTEATQGNLEPTENIHKTESDIEKEKMVNPISTDQTCPQSPVQNAVEKDLEFRVSELNLESNESKNMRLEEQLGSEVEHLDKGRQNISQDLPSTSENVPENNIEINIEMDNSVVSSLDMSNNEMGFNDTIEEMEKLLKYGMKYFETGGTFGKSAETPIVSNGQAISVSPCEEDTAISSCSSFKPNFDSTHSSSAILDKQKVNAVCKQDDDNNSDTVLNHKETMIPKIPPAKPPRFIVTSPSTDFVKELSPETNNVNSKSLFTPNLVQTFKIEVSPTDLKRLSGNSSKSSSYIPTPTSRFGKKNVNKPLTPNISNNNQPRVPTPRPNKSFANDLYNKNHRILPSSRLTQSTIKTHKVTSNLNTKSNSTQLPNKKRCDNQPQFLTPQVRTLFKTPAPIRPKANKISPNAAFKTKNVNIISPVAKYLQNNPPPPLVTTVKPKCQYKMPSKELVCPMKSTNELIGKDLNESDLKRDCQLKQIDNAMEYLTSRVMTLQPSDATNEPIVREKNIKTTLPCHTYQRVDGAVYLENKENISNRRMIPDDTPPAMVLRHKGRVKVPKDVFTGDQKENDNESCPSSPAGDVSLMEVSVYEPHNIKHTNTLH